MSEETNPNQSASIARGLGPTIGEDMYRVWDGRQHRWMTGDEIFGRPASDNEGTYTKMARMRALAAARLAAQINQGKPSMSQTAEPVTIIGTCSLCGGPVRENKIPAGPNCMQCGAVTAAHYGPVIEMRKSPAASDANGNPINWARYGAPITKDDK